MTTPTIPTPGDLGFAYELQVDIDEDFSSGAPTGNPDWTQLAFISAVNPTNPKTFQDSSTYYNKGAKAQAITGEEWGLEFVHQVQRLGSGLYIPTLQILIAATEPGNRNDAAKVHVRFYDTEGADYAREGKAYVAIDRDNTGNTDIAGWKVTLTGDGALTKIANPFSQPFISSVLPASAATGDQVTIKGNGFAGATTVKFGATNATSFLVIDAQTIVAVLPTGSAGSVNVTVTSPAGTTPAFSYTRGA